MLECVPIIITVIGGSSIEDDGKRGVEEEEEEERRNLRRRRRRRKRRRKGHVGEIEEQFIGQRTLAFPSSSPSLVLPSLVGRDDGDEGKKTLKHSPVSLQQSLLGNN